MAPENELLFGKGDPALIGSTFVLVFLCEGSTSDSFIVAKSSSSRHTFVWILLF